MEIHDYKEVAEIRIEQFHENISCGSCVTEFRTVKGSNEKFYFEVYANGQSEKDEGYVSIVLGRYISSRKPRRFAVTCTISIRDIDNKLRFPQSFYYRKKVRQHSFLKEKGMFEVVRFDKFIKNKLIEASSEFLHEGTLILHFDLTACDEIASLIDGAFYLRMVNKIFSDLELEDGDLKILFNSVAFQKLRKKSRYFKRIQETPMLEGNLQYMTVDKKEIPAFRNLLIYVFTKTIGTFSLNELLELYEIADKYEVLDLFKLCSERLKKEIKPKYVDNIRNAAFKHADENLIEFANEYILKNENPEFTSSRSMRIYFNASKINNGQENDSNPFKADSFMCMTISGNNEFGYISEKREVEEKKADSDCYS